MQGIIQRERRNGSIDLEATIARCIEVQSLSREQHEQCWQAIAEAIQSESGGQGAWDLRLSSIITREAIARRYGEVWEKVQRGERVREIDPIQLHQERRTLAIHLSLYAFLNRNMGDVREGAIAMLHGFPHEADRYRLLVLAYGDTEIERFWGDVRRDARVRWDLF